MVLTEPDTDGTPRKLPRWSGKRVDGQQTASYDDFSAKKGAAKRVVWVL